MSKKKGISLELVEKIILKGEQQEKVAKENKEVAIQWLEISKEDIEATKILYKEKHFALAVYHLQQAFEKLAKGYYLLTGRVTPDQARGHYFILDKLKKELKEEDIKNIFELTSTLNKKELKLNNQEASLEMLEKSEDEVRMATKEDLTKIIDFIEMYENKLCSGDTLKILEAKINKPSFFRMIKYLLLHFSTFRVRDSDVREIVSEYNLKGYIDHSLISTKLHYLCILTFPHFNTPRYPSTKDSKVNFYSYDDKLGIVSFVPRFITLFEEVSKNLYLKISEQTSKKEEIHK